MRVSKRFLKLARKPVFSLETPVFGGETKTFAEKTKIVAVPRDSWDGTAEMGLPILRVVVLHSHNPDGPQIWHTFNLHWALVEERAKSKIKQGTFVRKSGVKLVTGLTNFSHRHSPKMHCA